MSNDVATSNSLKGGEEQIHIAAYLAHRKAPDVKETYIYIKCIKVSKLCFN